MVNEDNKPVDEELRQLSEQELSRRSIDDRVNPFAELRAAGIDPDKIFGNIPSLEHYVSLFETRYESEQPFKALVHQYLGLDGIEKAKLFLGEIFVPRWHKNKTSGMVREYASAVHADLQKAAGFYNEFKKLKEDEGIAQKKKLEAEEIDRKRIDSEKQKKGLEVKRVEVIAQTSVKYDTKIEEQKTEIEEQKQQVEIMTDARRIVREQLENRLKMSNLVKVQEGGSFVFDDGKVANALEDMFLDSIVDDIQQNEDANFMVKLKDTFEEITGNTDVIEGLHELPNVDWLQSIIYSRTRGFKRPTFPYLITAKPDLGIEKIITSVDTAMSIDSSGSMADYKRFEIAQKATLATHALMRRLSPKNKMFLSHYAKYLYEITTAQLMKEINPDGGTNTHLALDWMLEKLKDSRIGMAYLVTDGEPNDPNLAIQAASRYSEFPNIQLRIFFVDPGSESTKVVREMGRVAGERTKVMLIDNYRLANGMIKDVADALGEMRAVNSF